MNRFSFSLFLVLKDLNTLVLFAVPLVGDTKRKVNAPTTAVAKIVAMVLDNDIYTKDEY